MKKSIKKIVSAVICTAMIAAMSVVPAVAGSWQLTDGKWWYQNDDGTYPKSEWKWIDTDGDGISENYYFLDDGYIAQNATIEGYTVNADGKWTVNGVIQQLQANGVPVGQIASAAANAANAVQQAVQSTVKVSKNGVVIKGHAVQVTSGGKTSSVGSSGVSPVAGEDDSDFNAWATQHMDAENNKSDTADSEEE